MLSSSSVFSLPSLVVASIFGALAILLTLAGICKALSLISAPVTPDLLRDAHLNLRKIKNGKFEPERRRQRRQNLNASPPIFASSYCLPEVTPRAPLPRPTPCRSSSVQTESSGAEGRKTWGRRPILGRNRNSPDLEPTHTQQACWVESKSESDSEIVLEAPLVDSPPKGEELIQRLRKLESSFKTSFH